MQNSSNSKTKRISIQSPEIVYSEDEIDEKLKNVTLLPPKTAFDFYYDEKVNNGKSNNPSKKGKLSASKQKVANLDYYKTQYEYLANTSKEEYAKMEAEDFERYKNELYLVEKYLIRSYHKQGATAEQLFISNFIKTEKDKNNKASIVDIEKKALNAWKNMEFNEKHQWLLLKEENDKWWQKAQHYDELSTYDYFCLKKFQEAEKLNIELLVSDCEYLWKRLSEEKMQKYEKEAQEENERRKEYKEIFELENRAFPHKGKSAYNLFLQNVATKIEERDENNSNKENIDKKENETSKEKENEISKEKENEAKSINNLKKDENNKSKSKKFNFFKYVGELWSSLPTQEKEKYVKLAHREELIYLYRKKLYDDYIKEKKEKLSKDVKESKKYVTGMEIFIQKRETEVTNKKIPRHLLENVWNDLEDSEKEKYEKEANEINKKYGYQAEKKEPNLYTTPKKKPKTGYQVFFKEKMIQLNQPSRPGSADSKEVTVLLSNEWKGMGTNSNQKFLDNYTPSNPSSMKKIKPNNKENIFRPKVIDTSTDKKKPTQIKLLFNNSNNNN